MCTGRSLNKDLVSQNVMFNQNSFYMYRLLPNANQKKVKHSFRMPHCEENCVKKLCKQIIEKLALLAKIAVLKFIKPKYISSSW